MAVSKSLCKHNFDYFVIKNKNFNAFQNASLERCFLIRSDDSWWKSPSPKYSLYQWGVSCQAITFKVWHKIKINFINIPPHLFVTFIFKRANQRISSSIMSDSNCSLAYLRSSENINSREERSSPTTIIMFHLVGQKCVASQENGLLYLKT